jgi:hypothetical protein
MTVQNDRNCENRRFNIIVRLRRKKLEVFKTLNKKRIRISQNTRRAIPSPRQFLTSLAAARSVRRSPERARGANRAINSRHVRTRPPFAGRRMAMAHRDK